MWENRESLKSLQKTTAHEAVANAVGVTISYTTFNKLAQHMGIEFQSAGSRLDRAMKLLSEKYQIAEMVA